MVREPRLPLTLGYVRSELRNNRFAGDAMEGLAFMLKEYDILMTQYRKLAKLEEYTVTPLKEFD